MLKPKYPARWGADDERSRATVELEYLQHLKRQDFSRNRDLIKFFAFDFFHDGMIRDLAFSPDLRTFECRIQTTWIKPRNEKQVDERGHVWGWFKCHFSDVVWLTTSAERIDRHNDPLGANWEEAEFLSAEIDTLEPQLGFFRSNFRGYLRQREATFHSLLIDHTPIVRRLAIVFTSVSVLPEEPMAWEQLLASGAYDIPWCYPPKTRLAMEIRTLKQQLSTPAA